MACTRRSGGAVQVSLLAALVVVMLCSSAALANASHGPFENAVYPYWSFWYDPATYQEQYELRAARALVGGLAPEWDDTNSTYYVRLAESAATYQLSYLTKELRPFVSQTDDVILTNVNTDRSLAWRQEGDEYFLVETSLSEANSQDPRLQFVRADVPLPCPAVVGARCAAYSLVSFNSSEGLAPYEEDGAVYFKKASSDVLPFLVVRISSDLKEAALTNADTSHRVATSSYSVV